MANQNSKKKSAISLVQDGPTRDVLRSMQQNIDELFRRLDQPRCAVSVESTGSYATTSTTLVRVPTLTVTTDLSGKKPVRVFMRQRSELLSTTGIVSAGGIRMTATAQTGITGWFLLTDNGATRHVQVLGGGVNDASFISPIIYDIFYPANALDFTDDIPTAGNHVYQVWVQVIGATPGSITIQDCELVAQEAL